MWRISTIFLCLLLGSLAALIRPDAPEEEVMRASLRKNIRAESRANQTQADRLNLPSNSSSIRENITDTFRCEGRSYGYYADVENDCQLFHVCLPTSSRSRNSSYRWSFICPQETVFNQEVLVCTRPQDSINCTDSPMYYDVNNDNGKVDNDTGSKPDYDNDAPVGGDDNEPSNETPKEIKPVNKRKIKPDRRKQSENIVQRLSNYVNSAVQNDNVESEVQKNSFFNEIPPLNDTIVNDESIIINTGKNENFNMNMDDTEDVKSNIGNTEENKLKRNRAERKMQVKRKRGSFRFSADA